MHASLLHTFPTPLRHTPGCGGGAQQEGGWLGAVGLTYGGVNGAVVVWIYATGGTRIVHTSNSFGPKNPHYRPFECDKSIETTREAVSVLY